MGVPFPYWLINAIIASLKKGQGCCHWCRSEQTRSKTVAKKDNKKGGCKFGKKTKWYAANLK